MPATISEKAGSTGADVLTWQNALNAAGFVVPVTGTFDAATTAATIAWQKTKFSNPSDWDGIVGPMSWGKMLGSAGGSTQEIPTSGNGPSFDWTPDGPVATDIASVTGLEEHTDNLFRYAVAIMSSRLKVNPDYVVAAMAIETNKTFSTSAENPLSHAIGLIQFMPNASASSLTGLPKGTGAGSGFDYLRNLTPIEQLVYVEKYFKPFTGKMNNPNDAYLAVFYPSAMGKPADFVIADEGTKVYEQNKGFDTAKPPKGYITAGDVGKAATNILAGAEKRPRIPITPETPPVTGDGGGGTPTFGGLEIVPKLGLLAVLLGGGYYLVANNWQWIAKLWRRTF